MSTSRLNAFTDGVVAILITIMVLNLRSPEGASWGDLWSLKFVFLTYLVSFVTIAIYWNNHHHFFHLVTQVSGGILWANLILLFSMSFLPFTTAWLAQYPGAQAPEIVFGLNSLLVDLSFDILTLAVIRQQKTFTHLRDALWNWKAVWSITVLVLGIVFSLISGLNFGVLIAVVASLVPWIIPDRQIERRVNQGD